jgi:hypothetical protein
MARPPKLDVNQSRKDTMIEQRDTQRSDTAQDDLAVSMQEDLASEQSRTLSVQELEAVVGGPSINNGP